MISPVLTWHETSCSLLREGINTASDRHLDHWTQFAPLLNKVSWQLQLNHKVNCSFTSRPRLGKRSIVGCLNVCQSNIVCIFSMLLVSRTWSSEVAWLQIVRLLNWKRVDCNAIFIHRFALTTFQQVEWASSVPSIELALSDSWINRFFLMSLLKISDSFRAVFSVIQRVSTYFKRQKTIKVILLFYFFFFLKVSLQYLKLLCTLSEMTLRTPFPWHWTHFLSSLTDVKL